MDVRELLEDFFGRVDENVHAVLKPGEVKSFVLTCKGTKPGEQFVQSTTSCAELKRSNRNDEQVNYVAR